MLSWPVIPRIELGPFSVSPHGIGIALGYFVGTLVMVRRARARGFNEDHAWNAAAVAVIGAIIGARVAYVVGHAEEFASPLEWLQIYRGGISLFGGLIGGFLAAFLYTRIKKISFPVLADLGAPGLAIGTAIGRIGDLAIGDHLGKPTSRWWGWRYEGGELISPPACIYPTPSGCIQPGTVVHQTALYDMVWSLAIFLILLWIDRRARRPGTLILVWALLYSSGRIVTDFLRVDKVWFGLGLTGSQLTAIAVVLVSVIWLLWLRRAPREAVPAPAAPVPAEEAVAASLAAPGPGKEAAPEQPAATEARAEAETAPQPEPVPAGETASEPEPAATEGASEPAPVAEPEPAPQPQLTEAPDTPAAAEPAPATAQSGAPEPGAEESASERQPEIYLAPGPAPSSTGTVEAPGEQFGAGTLSEQETAARAEESSASSPPERDQPPIEEQLAAAEAAMEELNRAVEEAGVREPDETGEPEPRRDSASGKDE
ncbi:MAG: prolipoprotein diacylglyceryl transferase [Actinomycetota bacterium]|nr:prolipoprotein diacylglyceryl transferase [Actinomycetota bacterium]